MLLCTIIFDLNKKVNEGLHKSRCFSQKNTCFYQYLTIFGAGQYLRQSLTFFSARRRQRLTLLGWMPRSLAICGMVLS